MILTVERFLKYVTSTPRAPLLGFSQLNPVFSIRDAGSDEDRLPSTSTCVNSTETSEVFDGEDSAREVIVCC